MVNSTVDIEIIRYEKLVPGGWQGSARINGKVYTGQFAMVE